MFGSLKIPTTSLPHTPENRRTIQLEGNEYTDCLLRALGLQHIWTIPQNTTTSTISGEKSNLMSSTDGNALIIDDLDI